LSRFNIIINKNLTGLTLKNTLSTRNFLRKLDVIIQLSTEETADYFYLYTEDEIFYSQWTAEVSQKDIDNKFFTNGLNEKKSIILISLTDFIQIVKNNIFYSPYGLSYGLSVFDNWKRVKIKDLNNQNLYNEYFDWRIEKTPEKREKLEYLREALKQ